MGRRLGRNRKRGERHPGGQLVAKPKAEVRLDLRTRTSRQPHRRTLKNDDRLDERAESSLGRLFLRDLIDEEACDAGGLYAALVGSYRAVVEGPRGMKSTLGAIAVRDRVSVDEYATDKPAACITDETGSPLACWRVPKDCTCRQRKDRYDDAFEALARAGRAALMAINHVVIQGAEPTPEQLVYLVAGLRALARHFGLTRSPQRAHYENTR